MRERNSKRSFALAVLLTAALAGLSGQAARADVFQVVCGQSDTTTFGPYSVDICGTAPMSPAVAAAAFVHGAASSEWACKACSKDIEGITQYLSCQKGPAGDPSPSDYSGVSEPVWDPVAQCWRITGTFEGELTVSCNPCAPGWTPLP
jgi:hypothetical protein